MSTIDLRELAKSLMFAEKAKEEAEELRRDNERLYEITVEHAKLFEKDQQTILDLKQTILNLEFKVKQLEEGAENLTGALISKGEKVKEMESAIRIHFEDLQIPGLSPSIENLVSLHEHACEIIENQTATLADVSKTISELLVSRKLLNRDNVFGITLRGKLDMMANYITGLEVERENYIKNRTSLLNLRDIQGQKGNWDYDEYMRGMFNGLELAVSVFEGIEPAFKNPIEKKHSILSGFKCKYCGGDTMCVGDICFSCNQKLAAF